MTTGKGHTANGSYSHILNLLSSWGLKRIVLMVLWGNLYMKRMMPPYVMIRSPSLSGADNCGAFYEVFYNLFKQTEMIQKIFCVILIV